MSSVLALGAPVQPTNAAPLPRLFAYTTSLGLERFLDRRKRGLSTLVLSLVWLTLAWRGSGRPHHIGLLQEPLLAALLGVDRLPTAQTLHRALTYFAAHDVRAAVEASYLAELPRRAGRIWAALDSHHLPYWGRGQRERLCKGWSGDHGRCLRGYRLYLAVDTDTGQIITFVLLRGDARDHRLTAVLARHVRRLLGRRLSRGGGRQRLHQPCGRPRAAPGARAVYPRLCPLGPHPHPPGHPHRAATALAATGRRNSSGLVSLGLPVAADRADRPHAKR